MTPPLVTILVTSYNYERFLAQAIESALHQDYGSCEVIVVDDGSSDGSVALARSFPVEVLELRHGGLALAVARGVQAARGDFIVILSADDLLHPSFVSRTMAALEKPRGPSFAYSGAYLFGPHVGASGRALRWHARPFSAEGLWRGPYLICAGPFPKAAFTQVGGLDASLQFLEDWDFWLRVVAAGYGGVPVDEPLYYYRHHSRASRNNAHRRRKEALRKAIVQKYGGGRRNARYRFRLVPLAFMLGLSLFSWRSVRRFAAWWVHQNPFPGPILEPVRPAEAEPRFPWLEVSCHQSAR